MERNALENDIERREMSTRIRRQNILRHTEWHVKHYSTDDGEDGMVDTDDELIWTCKGREEEEADEVGRRRGKKRRREEEERR